MNRLFPPYVSPACQRYMARWCVANRGIPFGSRATRSENIRDYDKPVRLYFNFDDDHPETFDREEFHEVFVMLFPSLYPVHLRPHGAARGNPANFAAMTAPQDRYERLAYEDIEIARFDRLQAEFDARRNK